jgi:hypothetical protein
MVTTGHHINKVKHSYARLAWPKPQRIAIQANPRRADRVRVDDQGSSKAVKPGISECSLVATGLFDNHSIAQ